MFFCLFLVWGLTAVHQNGLSMNQMLMGLSPNVLPGPKEGDLAGHDMGHESKRIHIEKGNLHFSLCRLFCSGNETRLFLHLQNSVNVLNV